MQKWVEEQRDVGWEEGRERDEWRREERGRIRFQKKERGRNGRGRDEGGTERNEWR